MIAPFNPQTMSHDGHLVQSLRRVLIKLGSTESRNEAGGKLVAITSAKAGEGKSFLATGLAMTAAREFGRKVALVDLNWMNALVSQVFKAERNYLLPDLFTKKPTELLQKTSYEGVSVLAPPKLPEQNGGAVTWDALWTTHANTATRRAPRELGEALATLCQDFDYVVADCPAVFPDQPSPVDAIMVATSARYSLLTVLMRKTARDDVKRAMLTLEDSGARWVGTVMNNRFNQLYASEMGA